MKKPDEPPERREVNPAARRDRPGEPHGELPRRVPEDDASPEGHQEAELDPRDQGGIAE